jgi:hypothetical protein
MYDRKVVAFIDVLGFSDLIRSVAHDRHRARLLIDLFELVSAKEFQWGDQAWSSAEYSARVFSDCACIAAPPNAPGLNRLLFRVAVSQLHLSLNGIFIRGGIDFGRHHESSSLLLSEALLNAHSIEATRALYPRTVLSVSVVNYLVKNQKHGFLYNLLLQDSDGEWFVDYLWLLGLDDYPDDREDALRRHARAIREAQADHASEPRILQKMAWLQRYHDHTVSALSFGREVEVGHTAHGFRPNKHHSWAQSNPALQPTPRAKVKRRG